MRVEAPLPDNISTGWREGDLRHPGEQGSGYQDAAPDTFAQAGIGFAGPHVFCAEGDRMVTMAHVDTQVGEEFQHNPNILDIRQVLQGDRLFRQEAGRQHG